MTSIPTKVANGRLIRQMELWGWTKVRSKGDRWVMGRKGDTVSVMAPQVHKGNSGVTIKMVYEAVTGGDAEAFWARKAPSNVPDLDAIVDTVVTQRTYTPPPEYAAPEPEPEPAVAEEPAPAPAEQENPVAAAEKPKQHRGAAAEVLQYLNNHPHDTVTAGLIARRTNMDAHTVGSALAHLCRLGHVERLVRGTYKLAPNLAAERVYRHEHTGGVEVPKQAAAKAAITIAPMTAPAPVMAPVLQLHDAEHRVLADTGDDLDALLELVLPVDYEFKPAHLRAMRKWQQATAELLVTLRGDQ